MHPYHVTVVIPCYNDGSSISRAISSVKEQTWPYIDIIVIDDGSYDLTTIQLLDGIKDVQLIRQSNKGLPCARNVGFMASMSQFVLPLDSDDWLEPNAIECLVHTLSTTSKASFSFSSIHLEGEAEGILRKPCNTFEQLFLNQLPYCILISKSAWREVGGYDERMRDGYEDWDFSIRLLSVGYTPLLVDMPLFHYTVSSSGMLLSHSSQFHPQLWRYIQGKYPNLYRLPTLISLWSDYRNHPSTYPLVFYFCWIALHRILPGSIFSSIFRCLRLFSKSSRLSQRLSSFWLCR